MIVVFRYGHRPERDKRVSTHVCLVARAFGADKVVFDRKDEKIKEKIENLTKNWGGKFEIEFVDSYRKYIKEFKPLLEVINNKTLIAQPQARMPYDIEFR